MLLSLFIWSDFFKITGPPVFQSASPTGIPSTAHLLFSSGPRGCIGKNLGITVVRTLLLVSGPCARMGKNLGITVVRTLLMVSGPCGCAGKNLGIK